MGSFVSSLFSMMLGWIRSAAAYLWNAASNAEGGGMLRWLGDNWLTVTVILCVAGVITDYVVHLLRWRSHRVWLSFLRRLTGRKAEEEPVRRVVHRQWVYADGTARTEAVEPEEIPAEEDPQPWQDVAPVLQESQFDQEAYRRQFARPGSQPSPLNGLEDYPQPNVEQAPEEPAAEQPTGRRSRRLSRETTRAAFQQLFASHDEDELDLRYKPAQPAIRKEEAYNKPYIPPQWKPPAENSGAREEA